MHTTGIAKCQDQQPSKSSLHAVKRRTLIPPPRSISGLGAFCMSQRSVSVRWRIDLNSMITSLGPSTLCLPLVLTTDSMTVLAHQSGRDAGGAYIRHFLSAFGHSWATIVPKAETGLFLDMRQSDSQTGLSGGLAGRARQPATRAC